MWVKMIRALDPPATRAASMKGLTFTASAWDLSTMATPPKPPRMPSSIAKCHSWKRNTELTTIKMARAGSINSRSANRMKKLSIHPSK